MRKVLYIMGVLNDEDVEWMARTGRRLNVRGGDTLIRQGEPSPDLFIVLDGHVAVDVAGVGTVARLGAGEVMGEMSFVDKSPPSATVRADGPGTMLALDKKAMQERLKRDAGFAGRFYHALALFLADRLRETTQRVHRGPRASLDADTIMEDELDEAVLDQVGLAGIRFDHVLKALMGARAG